MNSLSRKETLIIGAGSAGLAAAYQLLRKGLKPVVVEQRDRVGGIACTESYKGFLFDMGGHRFFSKSPLIQKLWEEILSDDFLLRDRVSRIYYNQRFFDYPLKTWNALRGLGPVTTCAVMASYVRWRLFPHRYEKSFDRWVINRFGKRLFQIFFKSYTEKVWGIPCQEISAEWAAQRIKDLSLKKAIASMLAFSKRQHRTLIEAFHYPKQGPSMLWNAMKARLEEAGGAVKLRHDVVAIRHEERRITGLVIRCGDERQPMLSVGQVISSMPISALVQRMDPPPPEEVLGAAKRLKYRAFLTVFLIVNKPDIFPDQLGPFIVDQIHFG